MENRIIESIMNLCKLLKEFLKKNRNNEPEEFCVNFYLQYLETLKHHFINKIIKNEKNKLNSIKEDK